MKLLMLTLLLFWASVSFAECCHRAPCCYRGPYRTPPVNSVYYYYNMHKCPVRCYDCVDGYRCTDGRCDSQCYRYRRCHRETFYEDETAIRWARP